MSHNFLSHPHQVISNLYYGVLQVLRRQLWGGEEGKGYAKYDDNGVGAETSEDEETSGRRDMGTREREKGSREVTGKKGLGADF